MERTTHVIATLVFAFILALAGCGKSQSKGSKAKSAQDAKAMSEKAGSTATGNTSKGTNSGSSSGGVTCDAALDGVGFCSSDAEIVFCAGGVWWILDCTAIDETAFCGEDESSGLIDCYLP